MAEATPVNVNESQAGGSFALLGMAALAIRLVQGFVMWGGASRRLFYKWSTVGGAYVPVKMDPAASGYVANKLLHAAPGSPLGGVIHWIVPHATLLHVLVWVWTLAELFIGLGLIFGFLTRLSAFGSLFLNVSLMVLFGWMGSTCVDEWTMSSSGVAMAATLMISGGGLWSVDHYLSGRWPGLAGSRWMRLVGSGDIAGFVSTRGRRWMGVAAIAVLAFTMGFYQYYRGAVISPLGWRVSFKKRDLKLTHLVLAPDGRARFHVYADQGPDTGWTYILEADLKNSRGRVVERWNGPRLSGMPQGRLNNKFTQPWAAQVRTGPHGLRIKTGAIATVVLAPDGSNLHIEPGRYTLELKSVSGRTFYVHATS